MRQQIAISLLCVYLFAGSTLQQLHKIPVLLEHYKEHQASDQHISVSEFITIHYLSGIVLDDDYARDMQLPYKSADYLTSTSAPAFIPPSFAELVLSPPLLAQHYHPIFNDNQRPAQFLSSIWQPPQA